ncbi:MAG: hypothetical protein M0R17_09245 [Candidatus Omnitrophica bacterium]|jgi:hypothetical protein|nr:hypothetical protein [Candidatus Omnitrophota bacterium]
MGMKLYNTTIDKTKSGKQFYESTTFPTIEKNIRDIYIISQPGDSLDGYAYKYYDGNVSLWRYIALANKLGTGSIIIPSGLQIRIPVLDNEYFNKLKEIN